MEELYILPFDHRATFIKDLFGYDEPLNKKQLNDVRAYKEIIWEAFVRVFKKRPIDRKSLGILVDEKFGSGILRKAKQLGITRILTTEKSGQRVFDFEYGSKFGHHILKFRPEYAKVLVRYNPANRKDNTIQLMRLKKINDFCAKKKIGFFFELLVPATDLQKSGDYDLKIRPVLTAKAIGEIRAFGVEPNMWKLEAMPNETSWKKIIKAVKTKNKKKAKIVVLGRAGSKKQVSQWLRTASAFKDIIGFAVGRTIFLLPLKKYHENKITRKQAIDLIVGDFGYFIDCWKRAR